MSMGSGWRALRNRLTPSPRAWAGARRGVLLVALLVFVAGVWPLFAVRAFNWTALVAVLLLPLVAVLVGGLFLLVRRLLSSLPRAFAWTAVAALTTFFFLLGGAGMRGLVVASLYAIVAASLAGAGLASLRAPRDERPRGLDRVVAVGGLTLGLLLLAFGVGWLLWEGPAQKAIPDAARNATEPVPPLALPDPGQPGAHAVRELTYGSGTD